MNNTIKWWWCICSQDDCEICFYAENEEKARERAEKACGEPCYCIPLEEAEGGL